MNRKTFTCAEIKDAAQGKVWAKIATLNVIDKDGDVILDGALADSPVVISSYGHGSWDGALPVGKGMFKQDGDALVFEGSFFLDTTDGRDTFNTVKSLGDLGEWSFSLQDINAVPVTIGGVDARGIKSFRAKEVSPVLVGASVGSQTLRTKGASLTFSEHAATVMAAVDELAARAAEVVALRAEKGKSISDESAGLLEQLSARIDALKALLEQPNTPNPSEDVARTIVAGLARKYGVTQ